MKDSIKKASAYSNRAQRNWNRDIAIPEEDVATLLEVIKNAPTKQNETHYKVWWSDDTDKIKEIYECTNHFTVTPLDSLFDHTDERGVTDSKYNVTNSQIYSNLIFAFCMDWEAEHLRSLAHKNDGIILDSQRYMSIGVAVGELILSANLLGYRTGLCSAFDEEEMEFFFNGDRPRLIVGVGVPSDRPRTEHEDVYNRDIVAVDRRTGPDDEKWKFPSFEQKMKIEKL